MSSRARATACSFVDFPGRDAGDHGPRELTVADRRGCVHSGSTSRSSGASPRCGYASMQAAAQRGEGAREQAGDVHLRDAGECGDLGLRHVVEEAQLQDPPFPVGQLGQQRDDGHAVLDQAEAGVHVPERGGQGAAGTLVVRRLLVQGRRGGGHVDLQDLDHLLAGDAEVLGELAGPRCPAEALGELVRGLVEAGLLLDDPARDADGPRAVAEVAPDLAGDRGDGERQEVDAAFRLEPVDRPDQPERPDLLEVVGSVAAVHEAVRDVVGHRQVGGDQLGAQLRTARVARGQPGQLGEERGQVCVLVLRPYGRVDGVRLCSGHAAVPPEYGGAAGCTRSIAMGSVPISTLSPVRRVHLSTNSGAKGTWRRAGAFR